MEPNPATPTAETTSLRERVYLYLKTGLNDGSLATGSFLDLSALGNALGLSRTPLRDALLRLEAEGFVTIHSRRGVMVKTIDLPVIRDLYQILGALEGSVLEEIASRFGADDLDAMKSANEAMRADLGRDDFDSYYRHNLDFHDAYLDLSVNSDLKRMIRINKERLYDFPRRPGYVRDWELASVEEHGKLIGLVAVKDFAGAAAFMREVHWSFAVQEPFVKAYYFDHAAGGRRR